MPEKLHTNVLHDREGTDGTENAGGNTVQGITENLRSVESGMRLKSAGEKAADKKEYSQRSQDLAGFPSSIEGIGTGRRPVEGDGRAEQTGSESCRTAENLGVFFPAAGFGDTLPEDIDDEQDAYGALKHGVGEHLKNMESCEGSGQRTEEQRPKSRYPAVTEVHEGKTSVHGRIENAAQGNDHMHGKHQGCRGNGDHGASYARHSGDEAACKPADKNEE